MTMKTAPLLEELAGTWEVMAEMEKDSNPVRRETLRECVDGMRMLAELIQRAEATLAANRQQPPRDGLTDAQISALMESADKYARAAATAYAESLYGTSKSYTAECQRHENEARSALQSAIVGTAGAQEATR